MILSTKTILIIVGVLVLGLGIGFLGGSKFNTGKYDDAVKKIDSLMILDAERKRVYDLFTVESAKRTTEIQNRISNRDENFKKDTVTLTSNELLQRIGAINNND